jgi:hypothetical protein
MFGASASFFKLSYASIFKSYFSKAIFCHHLQLIKVNGIQIKHPKKQVRQIHS